MKEFTDEHICIWKGGDRELEDVLKIFGGEKEKAKRYAGEGERTLSFYIFPGSGRVRGQAHSHVFCMKTATVNLSPGHIPQSAASFAGSIRLLCNE